MKDYVGTTKNGQRVYVDTKKSHAATHLADTQGLRSLIAEVLPSIVAEKDDIYIDRDMGKTVGSSDLVETDDSDKIVYAKRLNRSNYTRFAMNRNPEPTSYITIVLHKDDDGEYELFSAWVGRAVPPFPGDEREVPESTSFWKSHALAWGKQAIQERSEIDVWPWG